MAGKTGKATSTTSDVTVAAAGVATTVLSQGYYMASGATYMVLAGVQSQSAGTGSTSAASVAVNDSVAGAGNARVIRPHATTDTSPTTWGKLVQPTVDGWRHMTLQMTPGSASSSTIVSAALACVKLESGDQAISVDTVATTTSSTFQAGQSVTFTVGSGETWVVYASADVQSTTSNKAEVRLHDGTTAFADGDSALHHFTGSYYPWSATVYVTATGSKTYTIQYASADNTSTTSIKNQRAFAFLLPASSFAVATDTTKTSTTSASYQTKLTATYTALAKDHIVLANGWTEGSAANVPVSTQVTAGGVTMLDEGVMKPNAGSDDVTFGFLTVDAAVSAGSRTWLLQHHSDGTNTGRLMDAWIVVMALEPMTEPTASLRRQALSG